MPFPAVVIYSVCNLCIIKVALLLNEQRRITNMQINKVYICLHAFHSFLMQ